MNNPLLDPDLLDAVVADTCERLANLIGLPCPTDPANQLQLLALLQTGTRHALAEATLQALEAGYTDTDTDQLRLRHERTP